MSVRSRITGEQAYVKQAKFNGSPSSGSNTVVNYADFLQVTSSSGNNYRRLGKHDRRYSSVDIGSNFETQKLTVTIDTGPEWIRRANSTGGYTYEFFALMVPDQNVASLLLNIAKQGTHDQRVSYADLTIGTGLRSDELTALGTRAIAKFSPLNPVADTVTTLAEFISERKFFSLPGHAGSIPGEYLNYMFGIAPTVAYAKDLRKAIEGRDEITKQLIRDSGRWVRRDGVVYDDTENTETFTQSVYPAGVQINLNPYVVNRGTLQTVSQIKQRAWFSGAFTYHLPEEGTRARTVAELDHLYGVDPGLDTAWELLPYSWLLDYKLSLGSVVNNIDAFGRDGLVLPYAYIMCETTVVTHYVWEGLMRNASGNLVFRRLNATVESVVKQRKRANPFGFGILPGDLSTRQLSILAALGISRLT